MKISEMISESIVNLPEAMFAGSVINCIVDKKLKKVTHYILLTQEDEEVFLPIKKLRKGVDTYLILSGDAICNTSPSGVWCPINMPVFDTDGKKVGRLKDFDFDESGKISKVYSENGEEPWEVLTLSPTMTVVKGNRNLRLRKEGEAKPKLKEVYSGEVYSGKVEEVNAPQPIKEKITAPKRVVSDYSFLLGRKVIKDIPSKNMAILVKAGDTVTVDVVEKARKHGKLVELTVNSKKV